MHFRAHVRESAIGVKFQESESESSFKPAIVTAYAARPRVMVARRPRGTLGRLPVNQCEPEY